MSVTLNSDKLMISIFNHMAMDANEICADFNFKLACNPHDVRNQGFSRPGSFSSPYEFKWRTQMASLLSKYTFDDDVISIDERKAASYKGYLETQARLTNHSLETPLAKAVLKRARDYIRKVLGEKPDMDRIKEGCYFGPGANLGTPSDFAYLDVKTSRKASHTGSNQSLLFLRDLLADDHHLRESLGLSISEIGSIPLTWETTNSINLVAVPKKYNIDRLITPLALADSFLSNGIGSEVSRLLALNTNIRIAHQQQVHRKLVEESSLSLEFATADLSAASDSITTLLLKLLLPRAWWVLLKRTLTHTVLIDGSPVYTESVLPMGNGATFPLETLIFKAILEAVRFSKNRGKFRGLISVYGDDLIYPVEMHRNAVRALNALGFVLNAEKTFSLYPFRESCGADFFRGVDVRPTQLKNGNRRSLTRTQALAYISKVTNSLLRRWEPCEIKHTLRMLLDLFTEYTIGNVVYPVPGTYPDESGIKVSLLILKSLGYKHGVRHVFKQNLDIKMRTKGKTSVRTFTRNQHNYVLIIPCIIPKQKHRAVEVEKSYLWQKLKSKDERPSEKDMLASWSVKKWKLIDTKRGKKRVNCETRIYGVSIKGAPYYRQGRK